MAYILQKTTLTKLSWGRSLSRLASDIGTVCIEFINRQRLNTTVKKLSAKNLRDIGLTKDDLASIAQQSFLSDSSQFLLKARNDRHGNW